MISLPLVELRSLCQFISGGTPRRNVARYYEGDIPWITSADIVDDKIARPRYYITEEALESSATNIVPKRNILLVTRTGVGKVAITDTDICISQDFTGLVPDKSQLDERFLFYYLKFRKEDLVAHQRGATIQGITRKVVATQRIPLPPLPEQQRIAAILGRADRLRRLRRTARESGDTYLQSVFLEMFGDPASNPQGWDCATIGDTVASSQYGTSKRSNSEQRGYPILGMGNITYSGGIDLTSLSYVELSEDEFEALRLVPGDIIFNRTNSTDLVGKTAHWNREMDAVLASYLVRLKLNVAVLPDYFTALLNSRYYKRLFQERCKKAVGQSNISPTLLKEFPMLIPPLPLQQHFVHIVHKFERLRTQQREAERQAEHLFQALLHRAFQGEV